MIVSAKIWPTVWKLIRLRIWITLNDFRRANLRRKIGQLLFGLFILGLIVLAFWVSWLVLRFIQSPDITGITGDVKPILRSLPVVWIGGAFVGVLLTSFGVLLQALYLAGDLEFLLSAPVPIRAVFVAKLLQAILPNFALICLFAIPVLFGFGLSAGYHVLYYPLVILILAMLALAAAGIAALLVMAIVRVFPARRVAEVLGFVGALAAMLCSQSGQIFSRFSGGAGQAQQAFQAISRFDEPWLPLAWAGRGLVAVGEGHWLEGGGLVALTVIISTGLFIFTLNMAEHLYYRGWASLQGVQVRKRIKHKPVNRTTEKPGMVLGKGFLAVWAIVGKDARVLRRDLRNLSQLITPIIVGVIYAFIIFMDRPKPTVLSDGGVEGLAGSNFALFSSMGVALFVSWILMSRLGLMAFSQEGRNYWILKNAPLTSAQLLLAKYIITYLPAVVLGCGFGISLGLLLGLNILQLIYNLAAILLINAANASINLTIGVIGARMDWEDPRQMQRGSGGCLASMSGVAWLAIGMLLFFGPPLLSAGLAMPPWIGYLGGILVGGTVCLALTIVPLWIVRGRVERLDEAKS